MPNLAHRNGRHDDRTSDDPDFKDFGIGDVLEARIFGGATGDVFPISRFNANED